MALKSDELLAERIIVDWLGSGLRRRILEKGDRLVAQQRVAVSLDESEWRDHVIAPDRVSLARELTSNPEEAEALSDA